MSVTNVNPETGIRYGIISANALHGDVIDNIQNMGRDLHYEEAKADLEKQADALEEEVRIGMAEDDPSIVGNEEIEESRIEAAYEARGYQDREDFIGKQLEQFQDEEPVHEFEIDGVKGRTTWLGGALLVWVFFSPHMTRVQLCSPCVPNCGDLDNVVDEKAAFDRALAELRAEYDEDCAGAGASFEEEEWANRENYLRSSWQPVGYECYDVPPEWRAEA